MIRSIVALAILLSLGMSCEDDRSSTGELTLFVNGMSWRGSGSRVYFTEKKANDIYGLGAFGSEAREEFYLYDIPLVEGEYKLFSRSSRKNQRVALLILDVHNPAEYYTVNDSMPGTLTIIEEESYVKGHFEAILILQPGNHDLMHYGDTITVEGAFVCCLF